MKQFMEPTVDLPLACPPWTNLGKTLESYVRKAIFDFKLLEGAESIVVALSGGKDSLSLLFLLKAILGRGTPLLPLHAIHISGSASCGASIGGNYLGDICKALEIPFYSIPSRSNTPIEKLECYPCSRERRSLLFEGAKKVGVKTVAFGHHRDDATETLLLNLFHKGEFAGNLPKVPMHDYGVTIIRPLIYVPEQEIIEFAKLYRFARITCRCPVGARSKRMETKRLLTQIEELFPHVRKNLARAAIQYGSQKALVK